MWPKCLFHFFYNRSTAFKAYEWKINTPLEIYTFRNFLSTFFSVSSGRVQRRVFVFATTHFSAATPFRDRVFRFEITDESREHGRCKKCNGGGRDTRREWKIHNFCYILRNIAYPLISLESFIDPSEVFFFFFFEFTIKYTIGNSILRLHWFCPVIDF